MKISVITISYNSEKTIEETIKSVLNQSHKDIEFIIIDGNSKDNTMKIVNLYSDKINNIVSENDRGIYSAINKGIRASSGDIISILHSNDVYYDVDTLKKVNNLFEKKSINFLLTSICFKKNLKKDKIHRIYSPNFFKPWMLRFGFSPPHPGFFALKKIYNRIGFYDEDMKIASDFDFFVRLFLTKTKEFEAKNIITVSMSFGGLSNRNLKSYFLTTKEIYNSLKKNNILSNYLFICARFIIKIFQFKI